MLIAAYRVVCFTGVQTLIGSHPIIGNLRRNAKQAGSFPGLRCLRGGDDGIRTHDPHVANVMLSQLSYIPTCMCAFAQKGILPCEWAFVNKVAASSPIEHVADLGLHAKISKAVARGGGEVYDNQVAALEVVDEARRRIHRKRCARNDQQVGLANGRDRLFYHAAVEALFV